MDQELSEQVQTMLPLAASHLRRGSAIALECYCCWNIPRQRLWPLQTVPRSASKGHLTGSPNSKASQTPQLPLVRGEGFGDIGTRVEGVWASGDVAPIQSGLRSIHAPTSRNGFIHDRLALISEPQTSCL